MTLPARLTRMERRKRVAFWVVLVTVAAVAALGFSLWPRGAESGGPDTVLVGEARTGGVAIAVDAPVANVRVREAKLPGRPIVLIDAGHGGKDPGATGRSGSVREKQLTLSLATELADLLEQRGRVRVAMTREDDRYLTLEQRAGIARSLQAGLFVSLHIDSAPNPAAQGTTVYSLSDVASSSEAARFAAAENGVDGALTSESNDLVRSLLSDLALREQMTASAGLAERMVRQARGPVTLRPRPHQFAGFWVLRRSEVPGVLVEAGYISNSKDEARLMTKEGRQPLVLALAQAIEADLAARAATR